MLHRAKPTATPKKFDITLPGIDPRVGPASIVFTFSNSIASVGSASTSCGSTTGTLVRGSSVTVMLDNSACDGETVTVTLSDVQDTDGNTLASAEAMVSFLIGDVNADGTVTQADVQSIHNHLQGLVTGANFRNDVIANGTINAQDLHKARTNLGDSL